MQKQRGRICLLNGSYFLWDVQIGAHHLSPPGILWSLATLLLQKPHLFKHHFSSGQSPKKIKVWYLGEIKLNSWSIFSHSVILWIKVLAYLACRGWTSWKLQILMGFFPKILVISTPEGNGNKLGPETFCKSEVSLKENTLRKFFSADIWFLSFCLYKIMLPY